MNRTIAPLAAVAAGVGATTTMLIAASVAKGQELGDANVLEWCKKHPPSGPAAISDINTQVDQHNAYSWQCKATPPGMFAGPPTMWGVNMNQACSEQHGNGAWNKPLDTHNANAWRCYR